MKRFKKNISFYIVICLIAVMIASFLGGDGLMERKSVSFSKMTQYLKEGKVKEINISERKITALVDLSKNSSAKAKTQKDSKISDEAQEQVEGTQGDNQSVASENSNVQSSQTVSEKQKTQAGNDDQNMLVADTDKQNQQAHKELKNEQAEKETEPSEGLFSLITGRKNNNGLVTAEAYAPSQMEAYWLETTYVFPQMEEGKIKVKTDPPSMWGGILTFLPSLLMLGVLGFFLYSMMRQGGGGQALSFGKNRAKKYKGDGKKITFKDVAGLKEEKEELMEIVDFLKNGYKYKKLGARIPKGVLMVGPPGTGKTYISRATAGEAGVPFFTISGSDFVEMFVGVGASRVRDLFAEAKKNAPCIIFIDEIDAVGRKRGAGLGGGNDEREQTLNQLLVEMDGFDDNLGIIIMAATNRPDVLDPALLRPGRFDRQVVIGLPDLIGREEIIKVHSKDKPLDDEVAPRVLARRTPGFTPADIENLLNEAALLTARRNGVKIRMEDIEEATTKVIAGPAKKSRVITEEERRLTAYHEAGHAILMRCLPESDPVHQITIIPRGGAGGFTMSLPEKEKYYQTKGGMRNQIIELFGGRVAEYLKLDDISTGASNDIMRATEIAKDMVTKYGFSEKLGPVNYSDGDEIFLGKDFSTRQNYSEETASAIDREVKSIVESAFDEAVRILREHDEQLERVAQALLKVETLDGDQFERVFQGTVDGDDLIKEINEKNDNIKRQNEEEALQWKESGKPEIVTFGGKNQQVDDDSIEASNGSADTTEVEANDHLSHSSDDMEYVAFRSQKSFEIIEEDEEDNK